MTPPVPNTNPSSWIEMGLQGHLLTLHVLMENQEMILEIQNPSSDRVEGGQESHRDLQRPSMNVGNPSTTNFPGLVFFRIPTWETQLYTPMHKTHPMAVTTPTRLPNIQDIDLLYHH
ncbi:hypothetical protein RDI58_000333 [Solanum bulbocastanum]|uniref:Uncharacterized protein n=1 Tax=Solanum bulbocastanum TaxID=147425 RepID=A0AAN8U5X6_SOLBU